jgi:DNA-binding beta-propeller fold protein YncE
MQSGVMKTLLISILLLYLVGQGYSAECQTLLVAEYVDGVVYTIDTDTLKVTSTLPPSDISAMAITDYKEYLYFVYTLSIDIVNKTRMNQVTTVQYDGYCAPGLVNARVGSDGKRLYIGVIGWGKAAISGIYEIDLANKTQRKIVAQNNLHSGLIDISPDGSIIYYGSDRGIYSLNTQTDVSSQVLPLGPKEMVREITCGRDNVLYAALRAYPTDPKTKDEILSFNLTTKQQKRLDLHAEPRRILHAPDKRLYVLGVTSLYRIDTMNLTLTNTYAIAGGDMAMTADCKNLFISSPQTGEVLVMDPGTGAIRTKIKVGEKPYALHIY